MHAIDDERALAHWKALFRLPNWVLDLLRLRFLNEQPHLAALLLPPREERPVPAEDDPHAEEYWRYPTAGAFIYEIMIREAGHPWRQITGQDVLACGDGIMAGIAPAMASADKALAALVSNCPQKNLLTGVLVAYSADADRDKEWMLKAFGLRVVIECLHHAGGEATTASRSWDAERIEIALAGRGDPLRREALAMCDSFRSELTARFLTTLEWWLEEPEAAFDENGPLGWHGLFQLAKWRESLAWPVFRKLFSLRSGPGYEELSDALTEFGGVLLASVGSQQSDELRAMFEDESLDVFCRGACLEALTCLVVWNEYSRGEMVAYLRELLSGKLRVTPANDYAFACVATAVCDLEAWELRSAVEEAFAQGAVDEGLMDQDAFQEGEAGKFGSPREKFCKVHQPITDVAEKTGWLDESYEEEAPVPPELPSDLREDREIVESSQPYIAPPKVGRNDPCPCGSGKKYKKCCGA